MFYIISYRISCIVEVVHNMKVYYTSSWYLCWSRQVVDVYGCLILCETRVVVDFGRVETKYAFGLQALQIWGFEEGVFGFDVFAMLVDVEGIYYGQMGDIGVGRW